MTFKAGDIVQLKPVERSFAALEGATAVVEKVDSWYIHIKWDRSDSRSKKQVDGGYNPADFIHAHTELKYDPNQQGDTEDDL